MQQSVLPHEIFNDCVKQLKNDHKKYKDLFKELLEKRDKEVKVETRYSEFEDWLWEYEEFKKLTRSKKDFYFNFLKGKAKSRKKEETDGPKKVRRAKKRLSKFLKKIRSPSIKAGDSFADFKSKIAKCDKIEALSPELIQEVFEGYLKKLQVT